MTSVAASRPAGPSRTVTAWCPVEMNWLGEIGCAISCFRHHYLEPPPEMVVAVHGKFAKRKPQTAASPVLQLEPKDANHFRRKCLSMVVRRAGACMTRARPVKPDAQSRLGFDVIAAALDKVRAIPGGNV